jgi:DDE superfamily endonuclease
MDNCSAHRGQKAVERIRSRWPNALLVHTPVHASWINQIEIYFSIVQGKVLTPNDFSSSHTWKHASWIFKSATHKRLLHSTGLSRARIFALCWPSYNPERRLPRPKKTRHLNSGLLALS